MAGGDPNAYEHLRELFRSELEDQLLVMSRQLATLMDPETTPELRRAASDELYRAVHSVKGAAGAVGLAEPEELCHRLEDQLAMLRGSQEALELEDLERQVTDAMTALEDWLRRSRSSAPPEPRSIPEQELPRGRPSPTSSPPLSASGELATTVRVALNQLDELLVDAHEWLTELQAPVTSDLHLEGALTALEELFETQRVSEKPRERELARRLLAGVRNEFSALRLRQRRFVDALTLRGTHVARQIRSLRLQPVSQLADTLERAALEVARNEAKAVEFVLLGGEARADHRVIERLREPLLQLVRNAVVHGIERPEQRSRAGKSRPGRVTLEVTAHGTELVLVVSDDGAGLPIESLQQSARQNGIELSEDPSGAELLDLVCTPGLSTRREVDHQAGRGVGMDLVRDRVERLQGHLELRTKSGLGTQIELRVPVDLSQLEVVLLSAGEEVFAVQTAAVQQLRRISTHELVLVEGASFLRIGEALVPVRDLTRAFETAVQPATADATLACAVVHAGGRHAALIVDRLISVGEYVVKPLSERCRVPLTQAAVMLGEGRVAPLLNAQALCAEASLPGLRLAENERVQHAQARVLVVDDSVTTRQLVRIILESAGYLVESEADAEQAWARLRDGERFDAVLSDIEMPGMSGLELLSRVRASPRLRELPVVLITALVQDQERRRALDLGADAYVVKSRFDQQTLLETLEDLVG